MNYQPYLQPGFTVDPMPPVRDRVRMTMLATSMIIDGPVDTRPERVDARLVNSLYMPQADLLIVGTGCRRPLLLNEAADLSNAAELDVVIVRLDDQGRGASFDLKKIGAASLLCAYRLWMPHGDFTGWLVPTAGETPFVEMTPFGLMMHEEPPFADDDERRVGLFRGARFLSVAFQGWF
ncbi:MAG TPA: hypothetical protein VEX38_07225 [Fimbriimonadaceae bacterium]|nr:hypothetical protein [Fimbriimonadaceae bacterium]